MLNDCTYKTTGRNYQNQYWRTCYDCFQNQNEGACLNCIQICHNSHRIGPLRKGDFFCDCGAGEANKKCKLVHQAQIHPQPFPQPIIPQPSQPYPVPMQPFPGYNPATHRGIHPSRHSAMIGRENPQPPNSFFGPPIMNEPIIPSYPPPSQKVQSTFDPALKREEQHTHCGFNEAAKRKFKKDRTIFERFGPSQGMKYDDIPKFVPRSPVQ